MLLMILFPLQQFVISKIFLSDFIYTLAVTLTAMLKFLFRLIEGLKKAMVERRIDLTEKLI